MKKTVVIVLDEKEVGDLLIQYARKSAGENAGGAKIEFNEKSKEITVIFQKKVN